MPNKDTHHIVGGEARKKIISGINKVLEVIKVTFGPAGRTVLLPRTYNRGPRNADDGFMAAENILLKDPHERLAAEAFKEGIKKTNTVAGDGTTGTGILSGFIINKVFKELPDEDIPSAGAKKDGRSVRQIRQELTEAKNLVLAEIKDKAKPIKTLADLEKIALVSIGKEDEETAKTVAKMVWEVARGSTGLYIDNHIEVTEGYQGKIETEVVKGMRFPSKVAARAFANKPERHEMVAEDVPILITNYKLDNPHTVIGIINACKVPKLAIFAPEFSDGVLMSLVKTTQNGLFCYPIKCPALRTVQMEDLAIYTNAKVIDKDTGAKLENVTAEDLGFADKIIVKDTENREDAVLLGGRGEKLARGKGSLIDQRLEVLKGQLSTSRNDIEKMQLEKRMANLGSAVGVIRVGASTSGGGLFIKLKIEDAVYACKGALEEGYLPGGGLFLKKVSETLPKNILTAALCEPYNQLQKNAGGIEIGKEIIDPAKVIRCMVEHGVSIASTIITTGAIIAEIPDKSPAEGYADIANAIKKWAYFDAKHKGLLKENADAMNEETEKEFDRVMMTDTG